MHVTTTPMGFWVLLGVGLLTGLSHCVGMCGPLVGAFVMRRRSVNQEVSTALVLYQMGRVATYALLGVAAGSVGSVWVAVIHDWQGAFSIAFGVAVVVVGLGLLGLVPLQHWVTAVAPARLVGRWIRHSMKSPHLSASFGLGMANGLLPCGAVYTMALLAAMSGNPIKGAGLMLIFGFGTLPAMLVSGFSVVLLSLRLRQVLSLAAAILVVMVGLQLTLRGLALNGQLPHTAIGGMMLW